MTFEEMKSLPKSEQEALYKELKAIRKKAKVVTYSAMYGVGSGKLAREIQGSQREAQDLLDGFWKLNWAIKSVANRQKVKIFDGKMWLLNSTSGFWHSLRAEKDIWSTLNQSTGVYCFDTWVGFSRVLGMKLSAQFHDEQLCPVKIGDEAVARDLLKEAILYTNKKLKLNIELDVDVQFGNTYASVH